MHLPQMAKKETEKTAASPNTQKIGMAVFISHKVNFEAKSIAKQHRYFVRIKGKIHKHVLKAKQL